MRATLLFSDKDIFEDGSIIEVHIWSVPSPVPPSLHRYKYSLFYGQAGKRLVGFDNERGKGDHKHVMGVETPYVFVSLEVLLKDFRTEVEAVKGVVI
jgi:hypothetical protein